MFSGDLPGNCAQRDYKYYDHTHDGVEQGFQLVGMDWRYTCVNETAVRQFGYNDASELIGFTLMEKFPGIYSTSAFSQLEKAMYEGVACVLECEFVFPDGISRWYELNVAPYLFGIVIFSTDITEKKRQLDFQTG